MTWLRDNNTHYNGDKKMYYEEKIIRGVLMFRNTPKGNWIMSKKALPTAIGNILLNKK
jgi:hypothetical protein